MSEKPASEEFEEEDGEAPDAGGDEDVEHLIRDVESMRRRSPKGNEPAWRRLERIREERRTAELLSDFEDYQIDGGAGSGGGAAAAEKPRKKKKKTR